MKVESSDRIPPKLPANRVGNNSGTTVKSMAVNQNPISAVCVVKSLSTDFFAMFKKGDVTGIGSVSAVMFLLI